MCEGLTKIPLDLEELRKLGFVITTDSNGQTTWTFPGPKQETTDEEKEDEEE